MTKTFEQIDPFNPANTISGIIYTEEAYGDLKITHVNGQQCEQYICATPKFKYPGNHDSPTCIKEQDFEIPFTECVVFDKLDGTNILMFNYQDTQGHTFWSFKTRLTPFLKESKWGNWVALWQKMLDKYALQFEILKQNTNYNYSFELYGALNKILVEYKEPLDTQFLYKVDNRGNIYPPDKETFPVPRVLAHVNNTQDVRAVYNSMRKQLSEQYVQTKSAEGAMFYFVQAGGDALVYKCKPPEVLSDQAESNRMFIGWNDAFTTAKNALEELDNPDELLDKTKELLRETYLDLAIETSIPVIIEAVNAVKQDLTYQDAIIQKFTECGFATFTKENKRDVMRKMVEHFDKRDSTKIYNALAKKFLII